MYDAYKVLNGWHGKMKRQEIWEVMQSSVSKMIIPLKKRFLPLPLSWVENANISGVKKQKDVLFFAFPD